MNILVIIIVKCDLEVDGIECRVQVIGEGLDELAWIRLSPSHQIPSHKGVTYQLLGQVRLA